MNAKSYRTTCSISDAISALAEQKIRHSAPAIIRHTPESALDKNLHALSALLADMRIIYSRAMKFCWRPAGAHFRSAHPMRDDRGRAILATIDLFIEPVSSRDGEMLRSVAHVVRLRRIEDAGADDLALADMYPVASVADRNLNARKRATRAPADDFGKIVSAGLLTFSERRNCDQSSL